MVPLGGVQENGCLGVVGRGASRFPQILEAAGEGNGQSQEIWQEDMPKGLHGAGGWGGPEATTGVEVFPSAKITPSGPQVGGLQSREAW